MTQSVNMTWRQSLKNLFILGFAFAFGILLDAELSRAYKRQLCTLQVTHEWKVADTTVHSTILTPCTR